MRIDTRLESEVGAPRKTLVVPSRITLSLLACYEAVLKDPDARPNVWIFGTTRSSRSFEARRWPLLGTNSREQVREAASKNAENWESLR